MLAGRNTESNPRATATTTTLSPCRPGLQLSACQFTIAEDARLPRRRGPGLAAKPAVLRAQR
eukprot:3664731-Rhodomonas_salina.2